MKNTYRWAMLAAIVLSWSYSASTVAQAPGQAPIRQPAAGPAIALLDVSYIFKNHPRFKSMMEEMKGDVQNAEKQVQTQREQIAKAAEDLAATYRKGSPEYKAAEEALANRQAKLAVDVNRQKGEFLQREARIYNAVYQEILQATEYYCKQNGIDIVLKFNGDPVDVERPDTVLAKINNPVVYYQSQLDITPTILRDLSRAPVNPGPARTAPVTMPTRPGVQFK